MDPSLHANGLVVEVFRPSSMGWKEIGKDIVHVENAAFVDTADTQEFLEKEFQDDRNTIILLRDVEKRKIVGYTYAAPSQSNEAEMVAFMESIALLPSYQGRGLVSPLTQALEQELITKGFTHLALRANVENGYTDKILRHYGNRIVQSYEVESKYGRQRYFKIVLTG